MKARLGTVLLLLAVWPVLTGAGMAPPTGAQDERFIPPLVRGVLVVDPHLEALTTVNSAGVTAGPKGKYASLWLQRARFTSAAIFRLPEVFGVFLGCDPSRTEERFAHAPDKPNKLKDYIPAAIVNQLFLDLGVDLVARGIEPVITGVHDVTCTADPENPTVDPPAAPGILSFKLTIEMIRP
jgi:hypothetical protein